ncbi:PhzF family phenazine biosynthesis protein [Bradyrhizobium tropiciagri]|uniref:PhzF family phenazine biosynthesis protein n=1 Tax=Bradyrhizobium tropiciagri TaxID=312253 RepID=UPI001BAAA11E|nr:PhzF family phenazine biosynthesis protein [Bradyrhizobium tropiciagri]MBR0900302.1 PhzF family phenazine biosynthesis protein [Bradyrhizobium tropiciagri]
MPGNNEVQLVSVFAAGTGGGNPAPIVIDADGMTGTQMQEVARAYGHESGFVVPAQAGSGCDFEFRFFVPNHEMSMCGHATIGALWLLHQAGRLPGDRATIQTKSGRVEARIDDKAGDGVAIEISQPAGTAEPLSDQSRAAILDVLGINVRQLSPYPIRNACTARVKTLIPLASVSMLNNLQPYFDRIEALCESIGSTGLYPYAPSDADPRIFEARQFPKSSGYPEDAATGIAGAALAFGLLANGEVQPTSDPIFVRQGIAMGRPSIMSVRFQLEGGRPTGCWLGGAVRYEDAEHAQ